MADPATAAAVAASAAEKGGSGGLPQFDVSQWPGQMVWMLIIFGVMFVLFARVFVPRIGETIAARNQKPLPGFRRCRSGPPVPPAGTRS